MERGGLGGGTNLGFHPVFTLFLASNGNKKNYVKCRNNKKGLKPVSQPVEQFLGFFPQVEKEHLQGNFLL